MNIDESLSRLGATPDQLTSQEKRALDEVGYVALEDVFPDELETIRASVSTLVEVEGDRAGWELRAAQKGRVQNRKDPGTERLSNLVDKGSIFTTCFTNPRVLAAISYVLSGDLKLSSLNYRSSLPGHGLQPIHVDWPNAVKPDAFQVCNSIWLLEDFTEENGATRAVPGSHLWGKRPQDILADSLDKHPEEVKLLGSAGSVIVFNSHTWHGGTRNDSARPRPALHAYFCRRNQSQQTDQSEFLSPETLASLSPEERVILDA